MSGGDIGDSDLDKWDPGFIEAAGKIVGPIGRLWFRTEVRGLEHVPPAGGALVVGNHSGGAMTPDLLVMAPAFYERFGYDRPFYTLAHYGLFKTPLAGTLRRLGVVHADREVDGPGELAAAVQDRRRGARADRRRRPVR